MANTKLKTKAKTNGNGATKTVDHTPVEEMRRLGDEAKGLLDQIRGLFYKLQPLTREERTVADGRFREGEPDALRAILRVALAYPEYFKSLADVDGGDDPATFEAQLLLDRLDRRDVLVDVARELRALVVAFDDTVMYTGSLVRKPTLAAYDIAKKIAERDRGIRAMLTPAIDYYRRPRKKAARAKTPRIPGTPASPAE